MNSFRAAIVKVFLEAHMVTEINSLYTRERLTGYIRSFTQTNTLLGDLRKPAKNIDNRTHKYFNFDNSVYSWHNDMI